MVRIGLAGILLLIVFMLQASVAVASAPDNDRQKVWIFFKDKGTEALTKANLFKVEKQLTPRAQKRRAKVYTDGLLVDETDVPVYKPYVRALRSLGIEPIVVSRWLNGISARVDSGQMQRIRYLPFIRGIRPVLRFRKPKLDADRSLRRGFSPLSDEELDYGASLHQNELIHIPEVHKLGLTGQGVLIAVFDTGFNLNHEAFQNLNVMAQYDFINGDANTDNEEGDVPSQNRHGSQVLSILAGYSPGHLIGPAFNADFLLAKTEDMRSEKPIEEDYWIAAAEWADSLGADVISTSLGYIDWYEYSDMDGDTAPITIAADLAVKKGIVVVVAAGNEGNDPWHYITAPADGDSVISVGAVNSAGIIANFSSRGPTFDGRIKPEVVAMGVGTACIVRPLGADLGRDYMKVNGTSAACPQVAGAAALVLSAHPELTPIQVRQALLSTADRAAAPDNTYGYGLVNAFAAVNFWGSPQTLPKKHHLVGSYPNPFVRHRNGYVRIIFDLAKTTNLQMDIYNILGQKIINLWDGERIAGKGQRLFWDGRNVSGNPVPGGLYFCTFRTGSLFEKIKLVIM